MSTTAVQDELAELARDIKLQIPQCRTELRPLPSGTVFLDLFSADRMFVLIYSSRDRLYGVDEVFEDDVPFINYYRFCYPDFDSAAKQLWALVRGEVKVSANGVAQ
jgi:hypothetical protein